MTEKVQTKVSFDEDIDIMRRVDEIAESEGTSRAAIIRRAIRRMLLSLPTVPTSGYIPQDEESVAA